MSARAPHARWPHALAAWLFTCGASCHLLLPAEPDVRCGEEGAKGPPYCPPGSACVSGVCQVTSEPALGDECATDATCPASSRCLEGRCARLCCSSTDCGPPESGLVCVARVGAGGAWCEASEASLGEGLAGDACEGGAQCRSGRCEAGLCADLCCTDSQCGVSECGLAPGATHPACGANASLASDLASCSADAECESGVCEFYGVTFRCAPPCCSSADCPVLVVPDETYSLRCTWVERPAGIASVCAQPVALAARQPVGAPCASPNDCIGGICVSGPDGPVCSDVCCSDASCGDPARFACAPWNSPSAVPGFVCQPR